MKAIPLILLAIILFVYINIEIASHNPVQVSHLIRVYATPIISDSIKSKNKSLLFPLSKV